MRLDPAMPAVEPGQTAVCFVWITNTRDVVDQFKIEVLGTPASWTIAERSTVFLLPGETASVRLTFHPPRSPRLLPGPMPFGVHVLARSAGLETSVVEEGVLEVARFSGMSAELRPRTSHGRLTGRHTVHVSNQGNAPSTVLLSGSDPADALRLKFDPSTLDVQPGGAAAARVKARIARPWLIGRPSRSRFQVLVEGDGLPSIELHGTMEQGSLVGRWPRIAATIVAVAAIASVALLHFEPFSTHPAGGRENAQQPPAATPSPPPPTISPVQPTNTSPPSPPQTTATPIAQACPPNEGGSPTAATITDVRVGAHAGYDSLVIQFTGGIPPYELKTSPGGTTFTGVAGGPLTTVAGSSGMQLQITGVGAPDTYAHGTDLMLNFPVLKEVRLLGDSQGVVSLAIGLSGNICPRVSTLDGPPRLVVDFPTQ